MTVLDTEILNDIQGHLLETQDGGASISSGLWTVDEMIAAVNNRQRQLLKDTCVLLKREVLVTTPNVNRQPLPDDCVAVAMVSWEGADGQTREVPRADSWDADQHLVTWELEQGTRPLEFTDAELPTLQLQVAPAPSQPGELTALYAYVATAVSNSGIALTVPDELSPAVMWGALADLLGKVGRGQDPVRAGYAEGRYQEGVIAAQILLAGFL